MKTTIRPALANARLTWLVLAALLGLVSGGAGWRWYGVISLPWLVGAVLLWHPRFAPRVGQAFEAGAAQRAVAAGFILLLGLLVMAGHVFSISAAVFGAVWLGALGLIVATRGRRVFPVFVVVGSTAALGLGLVLGLLELAFRTAPVARRFGSPGERAAWNQRYDRLWERNVLGFRTPHEDLVRTPGTLRILALGDSFTWGDRIASSDSTWPALLESRLRPETGAGRIQVLNWGRNGFTTANEAELLRRLGWQLDPDLVIVQFLVNDALPSHPNFGNESSAWVTPPVRILPARFRVGAVRTSGFVSWLEDALWAVKYRNSAPGRYAALYDTTYAGWRQLAGALKEIGDSAARRGTPVLLVEYPSLLPGNWTNGPHPFEAVYAQVGREAANAGIRVLDLTSTFKAEGGDWRRWRATAYDTHPGAAANVVAARAIHEAIRRYGLLPDARR